MDRLIVAGVVIFVAIYALIMLAYTLLYWLTPLIIVFGAQWAARASQYTSLHEGAVKLVCSDGAYTDASLTSSPVITARIDSSALGSLAWKGTTIAAISGAIAALISFSLLIDTTMAPSEADVPQWVRIFIIVVTLGVMIAALCALHGWHVQGLSAYATSVVVRVNKELTQHGELNSALSRLALLARELEINVGLDSREELKQFVAANNGEVLANPDIVFRRIADIVVELNYDIDRLTAIRNSIATTRDLLRQSTARAFALGSPAIVDYLDQFHITLRTENLAKLLEAGKYDEVDGIIRLAYRELQTLLSTDFAGLGEHRDGPQPKGLDAADGIGMPRSFAEACAVLHVRQDASCDQARENYRRLSSMVHPDRGGDDDEQKRINAAWTIFRESRSCR